MHGVHREENGFTLIEIMIVIAIIGILAAIAIPNFIAYRDKAFCTHAENDANSITATLADYFAIPSHNTLILRSISPAIRSVAGCRPRSTVSPIPS